MNEGKKYLVSSLYGYSLSMALLGGAFFAALVGRSTGLAWVCGSTLLLIGGAFLWARIAPARFTIRVQVDHHKLFPGEELQVRVEAHNKKILPFFFALEGPMEVRTDTVLPPFGELRRSWNIRFPKRGVYPLASWSLSYGDPFGLCRKSKSLKLNEEIVVFPRLRELNEPFDLFQEFFGLHPHKGLVEDPAWYAGTREYTGNRPARFIHWKASARVGKPQEKVFEPTSHAKVLVLLRVEGFQRYASLPHAPIRELESRFEDLLETVASHAYPLIRQGASLAFATDGELLHDPEPFLPMGSGYEHFSRFLEKLARLRFPYPRLGSESVSPSSGFFQGMASAIGRERTGILFACFDKGEGKMAEECLGRLPPHRLMILSVKDDSFHG